MAKPSLMDGLGLHPDQTRPGGGRLLWATAFPFRGRILGGAAAGITLSLVKLAVPALIRNAADQGLLAHDYARVTRIAALILLLGLICAGLAWARRFLALGTAFHVDAALRARLFGHVLGLDPSFHASTPAGQIVSRATSDLQQIQQRFSGIPQTASNLVMFLGSATILLTINPLLAACAMGPILGLLLLAQRFTIALGRDSLILQRSIARFAGLAADAISGVRTLKGLGLEGTEAARAARQAENIYDAAIAMTRVRATHVPLIELLPALSLAAVLWVGGRDVAAGRLTVGGLIQFNFYVLMLIGPLRQTGVMLAQFQRAFVSAGLINALLAIQPTIIGGAAGTGSPARSTGSSLQFEKVDFAYGGGPPLLRGVDFSIEAGETVAIMGMAGSGKTSLACLIPRLHDVGGGRILIDGRDIREISLAALRTQVGMVFEDAFLFSGTVRKNIAFARPDATHAEIEAAARAAGAHHFIMALQGGYDARLAERGLGLSGGQRQRIALARALITDSRILVLDAATSAVDAAKEEEIFETLRTSIGRRTMILITHRPVTLRLADRVLLLEQGRIVAAGRHDALLRSSPHYRHVLAAIAQADASVALAG